MSACNAAVNSFPTSNKHASPVQVHSPAAVKPDFVDQTAKWTELHRTYVMEGHDVTDQWEMGMWCCFECSKFDILNLELPMFVSTDFMFSMAMQKYGTGVMYMVRKSSCVSFIGAFITCPNFGIILLYFSH